MPVNPGDFAKAKAAEKTMGNDNAAVAQVIGQVTMLVKSLHDYDAKIKKALAAAPATVAGLSANAKKEMKALDGNFIKWPGVSANSTKAIQDVKVWADKITKAAIAAKDQAASQWAGKALIQANQGFAGLTQGKGAIAKYTPDYANFKKNKYFV